ncbi:MAG: pre-peptidase C-terminal domain-containing protein [Armatimonadetes bacterium]|nr:pre-peptidase C-terminal domain-containing protein [Armatimonadota bacterium]
MSTSPRVRWLWPALALCCAVIARAADKPEILTPYIAHVFPAGGQRGTKVEALVTGTQLASATEARILPAGVTGAIAKVEDATKVRLTLTIAPDAAVGEYELRLLTRAGASNRFRFLVGDLPEIIETEPNNNRAGAQKLALPVLVNGQVMEKDQDCYRFSAKGGTTLVCDIAARAIIPYIADAVPGWFDAVLTLYDASGRQVASVDDVRLWPDPRILFPVPADGDYTVQITDILSRGRADFVYRLSVGALPRVTGIYPLGGPRGASTGIALFGANLAKRTQTVEVPANASGIRWVGTEAGGLQANTMPFAVGDTPEASDTEPNDSRETAQAVTLPVTVNGHIDKAGDADWFRFAAIKGQKVVLEVMARRLLSPLDSMLTLFDAKGTRLVENDDTTDPTAQWLTHHADSLLVYTVPADGDYFLRLRDAQSMGGDDFAYRLILKDAAPDFTLRATPDNPRAGQGDSALVTVQANRKAGFNGPINVVVRGLPKGFVASEAVIYPGQDTAVLTVSAPSDAKPQVFNPTILGISEEAGQVTARVAVGAENVMQAFSLQQYPSTREIALTVTEPGGFALALLNPPAGGLIIAQGGEVTLNVKIIRAEGIKGGVFVRPASAVNGVGVRASYVPADKDEAPVVVNVGRGVPVGTKLNVIIGAVLKIGDVSYTRTLPAIPLRITEAPKVATPPK